MTAMTGSFDNGGAQAGRGGGFLALFLLVALFGLALVIASPLLLNAIEESTYASYEIAGAPVQGGQTLRAQAVAIGTAISHAAKHEEGPLVSQTCDPNSNPSVEVFRASPDRFLLTCWIGDKMGFRIVDMIDGKYEEITAYFRRRIKTVDDLTRYIDRKGYTPLTGGLP